MNEKEKYIDKWYGDYKKMVLNARIAPTLWGSSYSALSKLFQDPDPKDTTTTRKERIKSVENELLKYKKIPKFMKIGTRRMWKLADIADWLVSTEKAA